MNVSEALRQATDAATVRRVFGDPLERDGVTVIPAAIVVGGAGGGSGRDPEGQEGEGGGFGVVGRPAGAYVIKGGEVTWRPAVDPNRLIAVVGLLAVVFLITRPRTIRAKSSAAHTRMLK